MNKTIDTSIKKFGNSSGVRLTKDLLSTTQFSEHEPIEIKAEEGRIVITKRKKKTLEELFEDYEGFYEPTEEEQTWLNMLPEGEEIR